MQKQKIGLEGCNQMLRGVVSCCTDDRLCAELDGNAIGNVLTFLFNVMYALYEVADCREVLQ